MQSERDRGLRKGRHRKIDGVRQPGRCARGSGSTRAADRVRSQARFHAAAHGRKDPAHGAGLSAGCAGGADPGGGRPGNGDAGCRLHRSRRTEAGRRLRRTRDHFRLRVSGTRAGEGAVRRGAVRRTGRRGVRRICRAHPQGVRQRHLPCDQRRVHGYLRSQQHPARHTEF